MTGPQQHANTVRSLEQVLVQYERAMIELGWTMVNVSSRDALAALAERADTLERHVTELEGRYEVSHRRVLDYAAELDRERERADTLERERDKALKWGAAEAKAKQQASAEAARLREALRPFVEEYDFHAAGYLANDEDARVFTVRTVALLIEHQRAARVALSVLDDREAGEPRD